jgi:hypothetical protein
MKTVYEDSWLAKLILAKGFAAITLGCFVLAKGKLTERMKRHEMIHVAQYLEVTCTMLVGLALASVLTGMWWLLALTPVVYYGLYVFNWFVAFLVPTVENPYRAISFEREAYDNEDSACYINNRPLFGWIRYIFKS